MELRVEQSFATDPSGKGNIMRSLWHARRIIMKTSRLLEQGRAICGKEKYIIEKYITDAHLFLGPARN